MNVTVSDRAIEIPADFPRNPRIWQAEQLVAAVSAELGQAAPTIVKLGGVWQVVGTDEHASRSFGRFVTSLFNRALVQFVPFK